MATRRVLVGRARTPRSISKTIYVSLSNDISKQVGIDPVKKDKIIPEVYESDAGPFLVLKCEAFRKRWREERRLGNINRV